MTLNIDRTKTPPPNPSLPVRSAFTPTSIFEIGVNITTDQLQKRARRRLFRIWPKGFRSTRGQWRNHPSHRAGHQQHRRRRSRESWGLRVMGRYSKSIPRSQCRLVRHADRKGRVLQQIWNGSREMRRHLEKSSREKSRNRMSPPLHNLSV